MNNLKSQFQFSNEQRVGIFGISTLLLIAIGVLYFYNPSKEPKLDVSSAEILELQAQIDSLKKVALENKKPKLFPFNPNYITDYKSYTLGMTPQQFDNLKAFRDQNKWINSKEDFKKVTGVSQKWLDSISPFFKFPDWVTNPKPKKTYAYTTQLKSNKPIIKVDINMATAEQLREVRGIGPAFSERIMKQRQFLNGFTNQAQLYGIWGLEPEVVGRVLERFYIPNPEPVTKINVNTATASDIATIPGISFDIAKEVWEFRVLRERINSISELDKIPNMTPANLKLFQLYLFVD